MVTFHEQFEICARKYYANNSILFCDNTKIIHNVTYNELLDQINLLANILAKNIANISCIGILIEPNPLLPAVILSVQKHDCPFFCIDHNLSSSDIVNIVENVEINSIFIYEPADLIKTFLIKHASLVCKITLPKYEHKLELWNINIKTNLIYKNISYIIQTSGTTGINKIVKVQHNCIMSNIESLRNIFEINNTDVIYLGTPVTFDPFIVEIMLALTTGACLFIVAPKIKHNRKFLFQTLFPENNPLYSGVTFMQMPPSVFLCFSDKDINKILCEKTSLRILTLGGENFPKQLFKYINWSKSLRVFNLYGITEMSCWASAEEISEFQENVSLGQCLNDTVFEIRDDFDNVINNGEGNLYIGSEKRICVIDDENFTEKQIIFRETGDIVRLDENSHKIFYVGRKNSIIKRLGHKVNLSEIEKLVYDSTELTSICVWDENKSKLILFIILLENDKIVRNKIIDKMRIKLLRSLSSVSMPDIIEIIPSIPLTVNGKTDRNCLLQILNLNNESDRNLKSTEVFQNIWSKYFGMSKNEINAQKTNSFLNQGGNSIIAIQMISEFDLIVKNSYSGDLMAMLLNPDKIYMEYLDFINTQLNENLKRSTDFKLPPSKHTKLAHLNMCSNANAFQIKIAWTFNLLACVDSSPVHFVHQRLGPLIAIGSHGQKFNVFNAKTGDLLSETILPDAVESSVCITNCKEFAIIGCNDGIIYFINIENGNIVNQFKTGSSIKSTPEICCNGQRIIFGSYDTFLYCLNLQGDLKWKFKINESIKSNVVTNENKHLSYIATIQGSYFCICTKTGTLVWKYKSNTPIFGSPCLLEEQNIIIWANVKGHVNCFDCDNGDKLWTYEALGFIYSSICKINKKILFSCFDHNVYCLECTRNGCLEIFKANIGAQVSTTPYTFNMKNEIFILVTNNNGLMHIFDFEKVILQQTFQLPAEVFSSPIVVENQVFVGCRDNNVYCLEVEINT